MKFKFLACIAFTAFCIVGAFSTVHNGYKLSEIIPLIVASAITTAYWITWIREYRESHDVYSPEGFLIGYRLLMRRDEIGLALDGQTFVVTKIESAYRSPFRTDYIWKQGWNEAKDWDEDFPHGLYSMRKCHLASLKRRSYGMVVEVELAGNIEIHEKGYRSQYARVSAIIGNDHHAAEYFGVPIK